MVWKTYTQKNVHRLNTVFRYDSIEYEIKRKKAKEAKEAKRREDAEIDRVIREILRIPADDPSSNEPTPAA